MTTFHADILAQPAALRQLAMWYDNEGAQLFRTLPAPKAPLLTGMGASFNAATVAAVHLQASQVGATVHEAVDLVYYGAGLLQQAHELIFVSQSGASAEVVPLVERLPADALLVAVTNEPASPLAQRAQVVLPIQAGPNETTVASRTYLNTLATLWLLARHWSGRASDDEQQQLLDLATRCDELLAEAEATTARWIDMLGGAKTLVFLGHGPHAATARQATMMLGEWGKTLTLGTGVGAFRHGLIEITDPHCGVVVFAPPGVGQASALALATELQGYGAQVLVVQNGQTRGADAVALGEGTVDEFLSPVLDVIPVQLFAEALARHREINPTFRYISKVIKNI